MATFLNDVLCGVCNSRNITKLAGYWCFDCDEGLCNECQENFHAVARTMRNHSATVVENYKKLPEWVLNIKNACFEHEMGHTHFCGDHNCPCCPACMSHSHKACPDVSLLQQTIKSSKDSTMMNTTEQNLDELKTIITKMIEDRQGNLKTVCDQRRQFEIEIAKLRDEINRHLTAIEDEIVRKLNATEETIRKSIESSIERLEIDSRRVDEITEDIRLIKQYAPDLQTFLGMRIISEDVGKMDTSTRNMLKDDSLQRYKLKFEVNDNVTNLKALISTYGNVMTEKKPPSFNQSFKTDKHAQIMSPLSKSPDDIDDIELSLKSTFAGPEGEKDIRGCTLLSNGKLIFASNNILVVLNGTIVEKKIPAPHGPIDIAVVKGTKIAVSMNVNVELIDIESGKTEMRYDCGKCGGLSYLDGNLFCCVNEKGVFSIKIPTNTINMVIEDDSVSPFDYCAVDKEHIYRTSFSASSVCCYSRKGQKQWELKDEKKISFPYGICVDNFSYLYVASFKNNSIVVVQPDGKSSRTILTKNDGLDNPLAISFHRKKNQLLVANYHGPLNLFKIV